MAMWRRTNEGKALRLAYWYADGVRCRKLELEETLSEHGVDIFLLNETNLESVQAIRFENYVCHRTQRPTLGEDTAILVHRGIDLMLCQFLICSTWRLLPYT
jgi:hypothetical protein